MAKRETLDSEIAEAYALFDQFEAEVDRVGELANSDISLAAAGEAVLDEALAEDPSISRCFNAILNGVEYQDAASINEISAWQYSMDDEFENVDEMDFLPSGGYMNFMELVSSSLNIELEKKVVSIDYSGDSIYIECADGSIYVCDEVIASFPLGVLKAESVEFIPALPASYQAAIDRLGFGNMEKVVISFEENFWGSTEWLLLASDVRSKFTYSYNFSGNGKNILCTFMTDEFARLMKDKTDQEVVAELLAVF